MHDLLDSLAAAPSGRATPVWFDSVAYCREKLLSGGPVPWGSPGEVTAFTAKAQGMFRSDALVVELGELYASRVAGDPALRASMAARSRPGYALRTLLADDAARAVAVDALSAAAGASGSAPVVLSAPSPALWLSISAELAGQPVPAPDADRTDTAAMYMADLLRVFATGPVDGLLLDEGAAPAADLLHPDAYRPVFNVADHYGWPVLLCAEAASAWPHGAVTGVAGWIGSGPPDRPAGTWGLRTADDFWSGTDPAGDPDLILAVVPPDADPERVMARVRALG
jgi:hypothetical protein